MRYRKLDSSRDMTFGAGQADFWRDVPEAPAQAVMTTLSLLRGEWYVDTSAGVPYEGGVLGKYTRETTEPVIREAIAGTEGVTSIDSYVQIYDGDTRTLKITATISTAYGRYEYKGVM